MSDRMVSFSVPEGGNVVITFPEPLSLESISDLEEFTALMFRRLRRLAINDEAEKAGEAEYASWLPIRSAYDAMLDRHAGGHCHECGELAPRHDPSCTDGVVGTLNDQAKGGE